MTSKYQQDSKILLKNFMSFKSKIYNPPFPSPTIPFENTSNQKKPNSSLKIKKKIKFNFQFPSKNNISLAQTIRNQLIFDEIEDDELLSRANTPDSIKKKRRKKI